MLDRVVVTGTKHSLLPRIQLHISQVTTARKLRFHSTQLVQLIVHNPQPSAEFSSSTDTHSKPRLQGLGVLQQIKLSRLYQKLTQAWPIINVTLLLDKRHQRQRRRKRQLELLKITRCCNRETLAGLGCNRRHRLTRRGRIITLTLLLISRWVAVAGG